MSEMPEILATVTPSFPRRLFGTTVLAALGILILWIAADATSAPGWRLALLALGGLALLGAVRLWQATGVRVELTATELRDSSGRVLARLDQIASIERGVFAFKPSNGFVVMLNSRQPRAWAPGLWWRTGRRVGVGGVTGAGETKFMADLLASRIAMRGA